MDYSQPNLDTELLGNEHSSIGLRLLNRLGHADSPKAYAALRRRVNLCLSQECAS